VCGIKHPTTVPFRVRRLAIVYGIGREKKKNCVNRNDRRG